MQDTQLSRNSFIMKTPQLPSPKLRKKLNIENEVWLKYENKHHYGSHKGRSIPVMIDEYHKTGSNSFVISSSGNAALAAIRTVISHNKNKPNDPISLQIFVGLKIDKSKLENLKSEIGSSKKIILDQVENAKQSAFSFEKSGAAKLIRGSTDSLAVIGYQSLASELSRIENLSAVFIPTSSGTTAEGLHAAFLTMNLNPEIHIVQTDTCHTLVSYFYSTENKPDLPVSTSPSLAGAIVDKIGFRKEAVKNAIKNSRGYGWIATNEDITEAITLANECGIGVSANSALSLIGLKKAILAGYKWKGPVVLLITGN